MVREATRSLKSERRKCEKRVNYKLTKLFTFPPFAFSLCELPARITAAAAAAAAAAAIAAAATAAATAATAAAVTATTATAAAAIAAATAAAAFFTRTRFINH